ncbi:hypothetical protein LPW11_16965 [Geomonas sp. RF6]|uniref:nitroreductase family protein n=1 Tax=Geomonas sp. RF6 TaxID=2897342 RepID=UPI001E4F1BD0|nr:nitroreductase family protein [Geomonas sp. RF6]UFS69578.1 hypothetical protein LPW11_16965 [Geomonas sp. RF6]
MEFRSSIDSLVRQRYSCRSYSSKPIGKETLRTLSRFFAEHRTGPFGGEARFELLAMTEEDHEILRGLGTYGFIKGATGYVVGAMKRGAHDLEEYGYLLEQGLLLCTDLGLGSCWLGGSLTKSRFAERIRLGQGEIMPAVASVGYIKEGTREKDGIRRRAGSDRRLPASELFFDGGFGVPLHAAEAGAYAGVLEMVRLAPSASNRQPWRIVRGDGAWHLYLQRTKGYGKGTLLFTVLGLADLQRVDMGIAMCHFELGAREMGVQGGWIVQEPEIAKPGEGVEYTATWQSP